MALRLGDVTALLDEWYPQSWAADWDAVGLVAGDPDTEVSRIMFAVDPSPEIAAEAVEWGADLLVVHHPLFLFAVHGVAATTPKGRTLHRLLTAGCGLFAAHTNADGAPGGVNAALAEALGLTDLSVIEGPDDALEPLDKLVTFVPTEDADRLRTAISEAGAGAIGDYDHCTFSVVGEGRFRPLEGAEPVIGRVGEVELVQEARIESVFPRSRRTAVVAAMRAVHPYEEPAFDVLELANPGSGPARGTGRVGRLERPMTLRDFADQVSRALPATAHGVRVSGDPDRMVERIAVTPGAGDSLLDTVLGLGVDAYVTSDLRHHRAAEFREHDGPALVDVAHWAAESTWLPVVEARIRAAVEARGDTVETRVSTTPTDPWTFRV